MNKLLSVGFLAGGILLLIFGISEWNSIGSGISRVFTGAPTNKATWMLVGGAVATVVGLAGLTRGLK
jgi:hypothetical protein